MSTAIDFGVDQLELDEILGVSDLKNSKESPKPSLKEGEILNPFFVSLEGSTLRQTKMKEIYQNYDRAFLLCRANGHEKDDLSLLLKPTIMETDLEQLKSSVVLVQVELKLLKNKVHKQEAFLLNNHYLNLVNRKGYKLENPEEIVIPLMDLPEKMVDLYLSLYNNSSDLDALSKVLVMFEYFNCHEYAPTRAHLSERVLSLEDSDYWKQPYNCQLTITDSFEQREFQDYKVDQGIIATASGTKNGVTDPVGKEVMKSFGKKQGRYIDGIENFEKKEKFVDASDATVSKNHPYRLYFIDNREIPTSKSQVLEMFRVSHDQRATYDLFNSFLLSKTMCHLVLNNPGVLDLMAPTIKKFLPLYRYLLGYAWICMMTEEGIKKTWTKKTDRYVFDINTASKLPFFPYLHSNPHQNPYLPIMVGRDVLNPEENMNGLAMSRDFEHYGIDTLEGFRRKFNIFTTTRPEMNIFDGLECVEGTKRWKHFAVSGSAMPACVQKRTLLFNNVNLPMAQMPDDTWGRVFTEYYDGDIDLMCRVSSVFEFMDRVQYDVLPTIKNNLKKIHGKDLDDSIKVDSIKNLTIKVHPKYIERCMKDFSFDYVVKNLNSEQVKEDFYVEYVTLKTNMSKTQRRAHRNNPLYNDFFRINDQKEMDLQIISYDQTRANVHPVDSDIYVFLSDLDKTREYAPDEDLLMFRIRESIRFKITATPFLNHTIEVFRVSGDDFFSTVARFHLPCVRSYYDGENVYMLPSCVSALMTYMNQDYKYFAGIRDPCDILIKYMSRGFGTYLNPKEKTALLDYVSNKENKWADRLKVDKRSPESRREFFSSHPLDYHLFYPNAPDKRLARDMYANTEATRYVKTLADLKDMYRQMMGYGAEKHPLDLFQFTAVGDDGYVTPLKKWVLDATWEMLG